MIHFPILLGCNHFLGDEALRLTYYFKRFIVLFPACALPLINEFSIRYIHLLLHVFSWIIYFIQQSDGSTLQFDFVCHQSKPPRISQGSEVSCSLPIKLRYPVKACFDETLNSSGVLSDANMAESISSVEFLTILIFV